MEQNWDSRSETEKKEEWYNEKPKFDNARKLKNIYFIDPEDGEYEDTIGISSGGGNALPKENVDEG